jgi:membrane protease YdiL (CAAX protease family)
MEQAVATITERERTGRETSATPEGRQRDWIDLGAGYVLIMAVIWSPRPLQRVLWLVAVVGVAILLWKSFSGWAAMGLRLKNLRRSLWIVGAALALAGTAIVVAARIHTLLLPGGPFAFVAAYLAYSVWAGVQQFLLQGFFLPRFERVIPNVHLAALAAAVLFAAAHLPNPILTPITFLWGLASCLLFQHYRNLYPLILAHAILGIAVAMTVPGPVDHNMRVGLGYLTYNPHHAYRHGARPAR